MIFAMMKEHSSTQPPGNALLPEKIPHASQTAITVRIPGGNSRAKISLPRLTRHPVRRVDVCAAIDGDVHQPRETVLVPAFLLELPEG
jgi:hypothetical protein